MDSVRRGSVIARIAAGTLTALTVALAPGSVAGATTTGPLTGHRDCARPNNLFQSGVVSGGKANYQYDEQWVGGGTSFSNHATADGSGDLVFTKQQVTYGGITAFPSTAFTLNWTIRDPDSGTVLAEGRFDVNACASVQASLSLSHNSQGDIVARVATAPAAVGAVVKLYRIKSDGTKLLLSIKTANAYGRARFVVADPKSSVVKKYRAHVGATSSTQPDWTPTASTK